MEERNNASGAGLGERLTRAETPSASPADQRLFDRGVVLRPPEPRHGPDWRKTDRRINGVQVLFIAGETGHDQIGVENLVADPVERVEPPEAFFGILLTLALYRLLVGNDLSEQKEIANLPQFFLEIGAFFLAGVGAEHAGREAVEARRPPRR